MTVAAAPATPDGDAPARTRRAGGTILPLLARRLVAGLFTLFAVSIIVFAATQVLPGNAATAVLGQSATPLRVAQLEAQMHLNRPAVAQYASWIGGILHGHPGTSLVASQPVASIVLPRILASARRSGLIDQSMSLGSLIITAMPEFVVALLLVVVFSTTVFRVLPAVSIITPGRSVLSSPSQLVLPVATLVIVIVPYI